MRAGNDRRIGTVNFLHLVGTQVVDHGPIRANSVGIKVGLLAQRCEPAAGAAGDKNNLNSGGAGGFEGVQGPRAEAEVVPDQGSVQVAGNEFNQGGYALRIEDVGLVICG